MTSVTLKPTNTPNVYETAQPVLFTHGQRFGQTYRVALVIARPDGSAGVYAVRQTRQGTDYQRTSGTVLIETGKLDGIMTPELARDIEVAAHAMTDRAGAPEAESQERQDAKERLMLTDRALATEQGWTVHEQVTAARFMAEFQPGDAVMGGCDRVREVVVVRYSSSGRPWDLMVVSLDFDEANPLDGVDYEPHETFDRYRRAVAGLEGSAQALAADRA